jgi:dolichol-phosphate mannosyltransferase
MMVSIVSPVLNEEELIEDLYIQTSSALNTITSEWEVICVNDGLSDSTLSKLVAIHEKYLHWKIISLFKNFGYK